MDIDALNYDGAITRVDYYVRPGIESIGCVANGDFNSQILSIFAQAQGSRLIPFLVGCIVIYLLLRIIALFLSGPQPHLLSSNFISFVLITVLVLSVSLFAIKAGEWTAVADARTLPNGNLPRVEILFKKVAGEAVKRLEGHKLRKIFMDRANLFVFAEHEKSFSALPPVYIISLSEISQLWLVQD